MANNLARCYKPFLPYCCIHMMHDAAKQAVLDHPNICRLQEVFCSEGRYYVVTDLCRCVEMVNFRAVVFVHLRLPSMLSLLSCPLAVDLIPLSMCAIEFFFSVFCPFFFHLHFVTSFISIFSPLLSPI